MKRQDLLKQLKALAKAERADYLEVEGGGHTKISFGGKQTVVPRRTEINELTAEAILKHTMR